MRTISGWRAVCKLGKALSLAVMLAAAPAALVLHSCSATGEAGIGASGRFKNPLGGEPIEVTFSMGTPGYVYSMVGGAGLCLEIQWRDEAGELLDTTRVQLPCSGQVPAGAVSWSAKVIACGTMQFGAGPDSAVDAGGHTRASPDLLPEHSFVFGGPIVPDTETGGNFHNAIYSFLVELSHPSDDAFAVVLPILAGGLYSTVPPNVEVLSYTQFVPDTFGAHLIVADTEPFEAYSLAWNGQPGYADLSTGTNVTAFQTTGWKAIRSFVPLTDFQGSGVANTAETMRKTSSDEQPLDESASCTVFAR